MEDRECARTDIGRLMTLNEAAELLHVSYATVFRLVEAGELKAFRIKKIWRTSDVLCEEYISKQIKNQAIICKSTEAR